MPDEVVIQTRNLTKVYRDFWGRQKVRALKALDLEVQRGEIFGLLGPNGSGKTTTIKLLLGLLFPTSGQALVFGRDATDVKKNERIGYLPEESYLYKFLTAEETLDFYGRLFKMSRRQRRQRTSELIEQVGLERAKKRQLREYSKGMTRRIGLAQALINDPELIILDEPTTGLDPLGTRDMKEMIVDLRNRGKTVVMCSHQLDDVEDVCDRIAILYEGELKELGRVDSLLKGPRRYGNPCFVVKRKDPGGNPRDYQTRWRRGSFCRQSHAHPGTALPRHCQRIGQASRPAGSGSRKQHSGFRLEPSRQVAEPPILYPLLTSHTKKTKPWLSKPNRFHFSSGCRRHCSYF